MLSKYHHMFVEAGYPDCDAVFHEDGSWSIRQFHQRPVIPALTKWSWVLTDIRHREISVSFIKKYLDALDPMKQQFWDDQNAQTEECLAEGEATEKHREEMVQKAKKVILGNEDLCERIAKNGIQEMDLDKIARHIPKSKF